MWPYDSRTTEIYKAIGSGEAVGVILLTLNKNLGLHYGGPKVPLSHKIKEKLYRWQLKKIYKQATLILYKEIYILFIFYDQ